MTRARCECCRTLLIKTDAGRLLCPNPTCPSPTTQMTFEKAAA